ncbi:MAG: MFS transporter [Chloroflexi bacterium]|nr:MAG: MFS transporter [Chloroflexota bacterium]
MSTEKISNRIKWLYGVADMGIAMLTASIQFFLLYFYTDVVRIDPALAGTALLVGKLTWDAFNDPFFGYLSDRTRSRWGRRRPYMLFGAIPLGLAAWLMYSIPAGLMGWKAFLAVLVSFLLFDTMHTLVCTAYYAMTPELTYDYNERTSLTTVRMLYSVIGYILGAAGTTALAGLFVGLFGWTDKASFSAMGATFGVIAAITILTTAFNVKERKRPELVPSTMPPAASVLKTFKNRPFMQLMGAQFLSSFSFTLLTTLLPYYLIYQLNMEAQLPIVMIMMLGTIGIFLFPWKKISDRINKGPSYALGLFIASLAVIATFFYPHGPTPLIYVTAIVAGLGFSGQWVFPWSMLPDVIEYDQAVTGERREGIYYGVWAFLGKLTNALGIAVSGWALSLFGYVANVEQTSTALLGIRLFFGPVAAVVLIVSLPLLIWYPITRKSHARLLEQIAAGRGGDEAAPPVVLTGT